MAVDPWAELLKLFEVKPEEVPRAIAELAGGGTATAGFDGILQSVWIKDREYWSGKFPYVGFPIFPDKLPPVDDFISNVAVPAVLTGLGALTKNKDLFRVGLGASVGGGALYLHELIMRNVPPVIPPPRSSPSAPTVKAKGRYRVTS